MLISRALAAGGIMFPLYIYPGNNCVGWTAVSNAITSHPNTPFYVIINPASGPGAVNSQPDSNYQACIPKLKAANSKVIGYVATGYTSRATADVNADIATYAGWGTAYKPQGIFFDEVSGGTGHVSLYQSYTSFARSKISNAFITLNPGTSIESQYFSFVDQIVTYEYYYSNFATSSLTISSSTPANKQAVLLHTAPSTLPASTIQQVSGQLGIGALFITDVTFDDNPYGSLPSYWGAFVNAVDAL
ncbi:Spherulation-specific family 4 [Collybia nuda]|uniref:Spherulation-specific family 4 n=1 Tax=Collybia nuda TaxID=64659 RepID=A0A9P5Y2F9_9AGAR|nr:Spherulation-specific family 4 [Collybia nuda]